MSRGNPILVYVVLSLLTLLPFAGVLALDFTNLDDPGYVTQNPHVQGGFTRENLRWAFTSFEQWNWHPVTWTSHMLDCRIYGLQPAGHHATSLLLHLLSTLLLFAALHRMTGALGRSAFVASLFAVHPLHVESVAWVAERKDVLSTSFWMLALLAYARYAKRPGAARYLWIVLSFSLGLAAKPMVVTLPFVFLLLDVWPLERLKPAQGMRSMLGGQRRLLVRLILEKTPFFVLAAASSTVTYLAQQSGGAVVPFERLPLTTRAANAVLSYVSYIRKMLWPADLAVFYPRPDAAGFWATAGSLLFLLAVTACALRFGSRKPYLPAGWLWFLGTLVPVIGLVQVGDQAMADRYTYVPLVGLFLIVAWGVPEIFSAFGASLAAVRVTAVTAVLILAFMTSGQVRTWKDSVALYRHAIAVTGDNELAYLNLGAALVAAGEADQAVSLYRDLLQRKPGLADIRVNLGMALQLQQKDGEALEQYRAALQLRPGHPDALNGLGSIMLGRRRFEEALRYLDEALRARPHYVEARLNRALVLAAEGALDPAEAELRTALRLKPDYADAHEQLANVLLRLGRAGEAIPHFRAALQQKQGNADLHYRLGLALYQSRGREDAIAQFRGALSLQPERPDVLNNLAWVLATRDGATPQEAAEALTLAGRAIELEQGRRDPNALDTLAAAYAATGRFHEAVRTADAALAVSAGHAALAAGIRARRQLYAAGRPYREPREAAPR